ncbi:MAG TPA: hypothetical protein PKD85_03725 [Saprospiraceae bacterium]|nr:hypothetical protein [Saprospiraceae bacterium]
MRAFKKFLFACFVFFISNTTWAQSYNGVVGLRANGDIGISAAAQILNRQTVQLEHQSGLFSPINQTSLMYKKHYPVLTRRFNVSVGGGAIFRGEEQGTERSAINTTPALGLTFGGEFTVGKVNITYDYMPGMYLGNVSGPQFFSNAGIGVRYVVWERESATKKTVNKLAFWKKDKKSSSKNNKKKHAKPTNEKKKFLIF